LIAASGILVSRTFLSRTLKTEWNQDLLTNFLQLFIMNCFISKNFFVAFTTSLIAQSVE